MAAMNARLLRPRASGGGFDPRSIAGLQLWLDAADSSTITVSTGVSEWRDKSTVGSAWTQTTGNNQPLTGTQKINGRNVILFDGTNDSLESVEPLSTSMPLTFFIVQQIVTKTFFGMSYTAGSGDNFNIRQDSNTGRLAIRATGTSIFTETTGDRTGIIDVIGLRCPSGSASNSVRRNGLVLGLNDLLVRPILTGTHYIAKRSDGFYGNVSIGEIIAFNALLSDAEFLLIESYLMQKWGATTV